MGLVPALLSPGANSTVSTLWPIANTHGAAFSHEFFESFFDQHRDECDNMASSSFGDELDGLSLDAKASGPKSTAIVDVALAVQEAIIKMSKDPKEP